MVPRFQRKADNVPQLEDNVARVIDPLTNLPPLQGAVLEAVALVTGSDQHVPHLLGRRFRGWLLARLRADARVYEATSQRDTSLYVSLRTSAIATVDLWVW